MSIVIFGIAAWMLVSINAVVKDYLSKWLIIVYVSYWMGSLWVSSFNLFGLYDVSIRTYVLLIIHVLCFVIGFSLVKIPKYSKASYNIDINRLFRNKLFLAIILFTIIFCWILVIRQNLLLATAMLNSGNIKTDILELLFQGSRLQYYLFTFICTPVNYISLTLISYYIFYRNCSFVKILLPLAAAIPMLMIGGGRASVMMILFFILPSFFCGKLFSYSNCLIKSPRISFRFLVFFTLLLVLVFSGMAYMTFLGGGYGNEFTFQVYTDTLQEVFEGIVVYSVGPFRAFDYSLSKDSLFYPDFYTLGRASLGGLDYVAGLVFHTLGFNYDSINSETMAMLQDKTIQVGWNHDFNYAYTSCYYYYCDLGILGVMLYPFLLGFSIRKIIQCFSTDRITFPYLCLIAFSFFMMLHSVFTLYFTKPVTLLFVFFLIWWHFKEKIVKQNIC